jgi:hypothetical protein
MNLNGGAAASPVQARRPRRKMNGATQKLNALTHGAEAEAIARRAQRALNVEAPSVILDFHRHGTSSIRKRDSDALGIGMGHDIG